MGRELGSEPYSARPESGREKRRKSVKQLLFVVASAYLGAFFGSILPSTTDLDEWSWALGLVGAPDLIYSDVGGPTGNMIIEVETATAFETQTDHTLDQLERYRLNGYQTVLAVPDGQRSAAEEFVDDHDVRDPIYVVEAPNLASLL